MLNEHQNEGSYFGVISYLQSRKDLDFQVSAYDKYSTLHYHPDIYGDLAFTGIAQDALRQSLVNGIQAEGSLQGDYRPHPARRSDRHRREGVVRYQ